MQCIRRGRRAIFANGTRRLDLLRCWSLPTSLLRASIGDKASARAPYVGLVYVRKRGGRRKSLYYRCLTVNVMAAISLLFGNTMPLLL